MHAGMNGEDLGQPDDSKNPQHLALRRGAQQVTPSAPGLQPREYQRRHAAGVDELQACRSMMTTRARAATATSAAATLAASATSSSPRNATTA